MSVIPFMAATDTARALPGDDIPWLQARRESGRSRFDKLGIPTPKLENWKFTRLRPLDNTQYTPATDKDGQVEISKIPSIGNTQARLVFVNGRLRDDLSDVSDLPTGVRFGSIDAALKSDADWVQEHLGKVADDADEAMVSLNEAMLDSGFVLHVPKGVVLTRPLEVIYIGGLTDGAVAYFPRNLIAIEEGAQATLFKHHEGRGVGEYFANAVTEVSVAQGAIFKHYKVQAESLYATHVTTLYADVGRDATYESFNLSIGGLLSRSDLKINLSGQGAHAAVNGAYLMRGKEHCDNTSLIDMSVPNTTCKQVYKGVLDDESRAVFQGKIHVARDAQKADGRMLCKTLLLTNDAEIDVKPELEIYADDVQCAHGATTGQLDKTALFYLRSRGIPEALARNMLVQSFIGDALLEITDETVRSALSDRIVRWLPAHCYLAEEWKEIA
jgi:Fe-S cluster assembly protein SufD